MYTIRTPAHTRTCMEAQTRSSLQNELPGPGNYYKPTTFVKSAETCGSVSKLGYGVGFVSKVGRPGGCARASQAPNSHRLHPNTQTKRFGEQERRHLQAHLDPAPGQYSAPAYVHSSLCCVCHTPPTKHSPQLWLLRQQTRIWATKSFSTAPTTGLFAKPRRVNESRAPTH